MLPRHGEPGCGNPRLRQAAQRAVEALKACADQFNVLPLIREIHAAGITGGNAIAAKLNERGVKAR